MGRAAGGVGLSGASPWGILGGTFDPPHYGHLALAEEAREWLGLAGVIFVPAGRPPHKDAREVTPAVHREAMLRLAIEGNDAFELSRTELERPGPSYAVDTVAEIAHQSEREGRPEPRFIMSAEALEGLASWHAPSRILELCRVAVAPRADAGPPDRALLGQRFPGDEDRFELLPGPRLGHSSSAIRDRVRRGHTIRYLVPDAVRTYIIEHDLYRASAG